ncbi:hypothetical protein MAJHIDBO_00531 [Propionibacterium freudenreichii subsp. shermanii]|nr:hypothetical protein MAJHIDBO_00531 [Propionibacterium freudenreichii subsp. shermanii]SPS08348.1 hypothetical protein MAJHIDBO_00531 [Propionibacterium freudenreichii subsp. shermanii]
MAGRVLVQVGTLVQRHLEQGVTGQEEDHHLGAARVQAPVVLGAELVDVGDHIGHIRVEQAGALIGVVGLEGVDEVAQRRLRIDEDHLAIGQVHPHVRAEPAVCGLGGHLGVEVHPVHQSGDLHGALELGLAPGTPHLGLAQGRHERLGLAAQRLIAVAHAGHLLGQVGGALGTGPLHLQQAVIHLVEALGHRLHEQLRLGQALPGGLVHRQGLPLHRLARQPLEFPRHRLAIGLRALQLRLQGIALGHGTGQFAGASDVPGPRVQGTDEEADGQAHGQQQQHGDHHGGDTHGPILAQPCDISGHAVLRPGAGPLPGAGEPSPTPRVRRVTRTGS